MTRAQRLELLKQIEKDIHVCSLESTFLDDAKSCAIHSVIEELEQEPFINKTCISSEVCEHDKNKVLDKIRAEVENINVWGMRYNPDTYLDQKPQIVQKVKEHVIEIIDRYKAEIEPQESEDK